MRCVLVGNYGVSNIGDEALREYFVSAFPEIEWTVLGVDVPRLPFGIRSFFTPWMNTLAAFWHADAVVFGGGSLFTDSESVFACFLWFWHGFVARMFGKPIVLAFQGVGPFRTVVGEALARFVFRKASLISVRDLESFARVRAWNTHVAPVLTADPALLLFSRFSEPRTKTGMLTVIPRTCLPDAFFGLLRNALTEKPKSVTILLMQPNEERKIAEELVRRCDGIPCSVRSPETLPELLRVIAASSRVLTARYHGALAAFALGIPCTICSQRAGDKLDAFRGAMSESGVLEKLLTLAKAGEHALRASLKRHL